MVEDRNEAYFVTFEVGFLHEHTRDVALADLLLFSRADVETGIQRRRRKLKGFRKNHFVKVLRQVRWQRLIIRQDNIRSSLGMHARGATVAVDEFFLFGW